MASLGMDKRDPAGTRLRGLAPNTASTAREGKAITRSHQQNKIVALGGVWVRTKNAAGCRLRAGATAAGPGG